MNLLVNSLKKAYATLAPRNIKTYEAIKTLKTSELRPAFDIFEKSTSQNTIKTYALPTKKLLTHNSIQKTNNISDGITSKTLYEDINLLENDAKICIGDMEISIKGPHRRKLKKLNIGDSVFIGGGSTEEKEFFNVAGLKVNQLTITKNSENSFKIVNNFDNMTKKTISSIEEALDEIKNTHPQFHDIVKKEYECGNVNKNTIELLANVIQNPITELKYLNAISHYKNEGFKYINKLMRGEKLENISDEYLIKIKKEIRNLSEIISSKTYEKPLQLFRGDDYELLDNVILQGGSFAGQKLSDVLKQANNLSIQQKKEILFDILLTNDIELKQKSFLSTSLLKNIRPKKDSPLQFEFTTEGKINGIALDTNIKSCWENEIEYLVQENTNMYIRNISPTESGQWTIETILKGN